ncbi:MAG: hypothetical protein JSV88_26930 [Candidatus Aminicenantes bacterium]|nr:MAG: hypothetical protein JSV88_26930 [Candidatus Aminicenantes bacterium]
MKLTRAFAATEQELDELLAKSTPYSLSSPKFGNPTIHDFVKGLILSTNIIEVIDKHIPNGYRADWGQVIDDRHGDILSKECDIIIYKGKPFKKIENKSMRFVFVGKKQAKVVIQAKSSIASVTREDKIYCKELKKFVPQIWYIAECCWANSKNRAEKLKKNLKDAGYNDFFYFYRMNADTEEKTIDPEPFVQFIKLIKKIK